MDSISYSAFRTTIRLNFLNFEERPELFKPSDSRGEGKADLDIYLYRGKRKEISRKAERSRFPVSAETFEGKKVIRLYDGKSKRVFCFFEEGLLIDLVTNRALNLPLMDLQNVLDIVFMHSASIVMNGKAYLFIAPSGGGKSTIAALARDEGFFVIDDDFCAVKRSGGSFFAARFPCFLSKRKRFKEWEVGGLFLLNKSKENKVRPVSGIEALRDALPEAVRYPRERVGAMRNQDYLRDVFCFLDEMIDRVGLSVLDFKKEAGVFSCLV